MVGVPAVLLAIAIGLFSYWLYKAEKVRRNVDKLGGPKSLPIIGNVHQLKRGRREFSKQLFELMEEFQHLKVFRLLIGSQPLIMVTDPEMAEPLMNSSKHMDKSDEYKYLHPWLGTGLLTSTGDKWKSRRKLLTPTFHFKILNDFVKVFNDQTKVLVSKLQKKTAQQKRQNVFNDLTLCALDIICETAMGRSVNAQENKDSEYVQAVYNASEYVFMRQRTPWYRPEFLFNTIGPGKKFQHCLSVMHGFTEKVIRERQAMFSSQHDANVTMEDLLNKGDSKRRLAFLDMLMCATAEGQKLSFLDIREEVDTFMFEGHDTTAMASSWATHLIGADEKIQAQVHEELDRIFGDSDRDVTMDDLKEMKYLERCIKEALRMFPSVPFFGRSLTEDTCLGYGGPVYDILKAGVVLPKKTTVLIVPAALHRDPKYFPDPERFDPDRFLPENTVSRHPYAYIPFSAGARNCIGQKFALMEEKVILSAVFRHFHVKSLQTRDELFPMSELILRPDEGIDVELTPRVKA